MSLNIAHCVLYLQSLYYCSTDVISCLIKYTYILYVCKSYIINAIIISLTPTSIQKLCIVIIHYHVASTTYNKTLRRPASVSRIVRCHQILCPSRAFRAHAHQALDLTFRAISTPHCHTAAPGSANCVLPTRTTQYYDLR